MLMSLLIKKKIHCIDSNKFGKLKSPKISSTFNKKLILSNICNKYGSNNEKNLKKNLPRY